MGTKMNFNLKIIRPGLVILLAGFCFGFVAYANNTNDANKPNEINSKNGFNAALNTTKKPTQHLSLTPLHTQNTIISSPSLVLLKQYKPGQNVNGWLMSEKLDGVRAYWNGRQLMSRNGKPFAVPAWFTENFPPFELDGELWLGRHQFEQTISIVNTQTAHAGWRDLSYQIFELPNQAGGLLARMNVLNLYLKQFKAPYLRIIEQVTVKNESHLQSELERVLALNGEGLVVRQPESLYQTGRSNEALKVKLKQDAECVVKGYTHGKGKYLGKVGALKCSVAQGLFTKLITPEERELNIGSGLTDLQRSQPPKIGAVITFQYMGFTQKGLPRFPVFLRVRSDH